MCKRSDCALSVAAFLPTDDAKLRAEKVMIMIVISSLGRRLYQHKKAVVAALFGAQENCHCCIIWGTGKLLLLHYLGHKKTCRCCIIWGTRKQLLLHYLGHKKTVVAALFGAQENCCCCIIWGTRKLSLLHYLGHTKNCCCCIIWGTRK